MRLAAAAPARLPHRLARRGARPRPGQPAVRRHRVPGAHRPDPAADLLPVDHHGRAGRDGGHRDRHRPGRPPRRRGHPDDGRGAGRRAGRLGARSAGSRSGRVRGRRPAQRDERRLGGRRGTAGPVIARAVVLASGGFEWNPRLQEAFLPNPVTPISAPSNTGDGLELGLAAGGAVTTMRAVWGVPVLQDPDHVYDGRPSGRMANVELTLPGSIMVNAAGRRFVNEAVNYHDLNKVVPGDRPEHRGATRTSRPGWWWTADYVSRYSIGGTPVGAGAVLGDSADTLDGAGRGLRDRPRRAGDDGRRVQQARRRRARPAVRPRRQRRGPVPRRPPASRTRAWRRWPQAPFHAIPIRPGTLGTCGGLVTDEDGRGAGPARRPIGEPVRRRQRRGHGVRRRLPRRRGDAGLGRSPAAYAVGRAPRRTTLKSDVRKETTWTLHAVIYRYADRLGRPGRAPSGAQGLPALAVRAGRDRRQRSADRRRPGRAAHPRRRDPEEVAALLDKDPFHVSG